MSPKTIRGPRGFGFSRTFWATLVLGGLALSPASSGAWHAAGPYGGTAAYITVDPQNPKTLLVGSVNSLIFRSPDAGKTWSRLPFPRNFSGNVRTLLIDPKDSRHYFAGLQVTGSTGAGLYESKDAGETWKAVPDLSGISIEALAAWPKDSATIVAGTRSGVWLSLNNGAAWRRISPSGNPQLQFVTAIAFHPEDSDIIFAGTSHLPWKTVDGGKTWRSIHDGMADDSDVFSVTIDSRSPKRVFASACSGIYRSQSGGERWEKAQGIPSSHRRTHVIIQSPERAETVYAGTTLGLLRSMDGGVSWRQVNDLHVNSIVFDPSDPSVLYLATEYSGVWKSADGGETLDSLNFGFVSRKVGRMASTGDRLYASTVQAAGTGAIFRSDDQGLNWSMIANAEALTEAHIQGIAASPSYKDILFAWNESKVLKSLDGGKLWAPTPRQPMSLPAPGVPMVPLRINSILLIGSEKPVLLAGTSGGLFLSANLGDAWMEVRLDYRFGTPVYSLHQAADSGRTLLLRAAECLFVSTDAGQNWLKIPAPVSPLMIYDLAVGPGNEVPILAATAEGIFQSGYGGRSWILRTSGISAGTVASVRYHPLRQKEAYAVQFGRLYRSVDGGTTWHLKPEAPLRDTFVRDLSFFPEVPDRLFAVTVDTGLMFVDLSN